MRTTFVIAPALSGKTLAAALRAQDPALSWELARSLCRRGKITIGGEVANDGARRVRAGEEVVRDDAAKVPARAAAKARVAYEDAHVVVIDKPSGVSSVPYEKREGGTAMDLVREAWRARGEAATSRPLHVVHRIDKETSGLLAFARTKAAERGLQDLFRAHDVERTYVCVAHGKVGDRRIESRLVTDRGDGLRGSTRRPGQGKRAVTHVRALEFLGAATLCEVRLETGKTHQIRIHLAEDGHPLVGERVYIRDYTRKGHDPIASERLLLHAATLGFRHPITGRHVQLSSPLPADFTAMLERLRR
jgi:23S rRNA pseudouridine1911/1915/1917 synthase